jgi:hypothetical protein
MEIQGVELKVFKAMLRFLCTDVLPEMEEKENVTTMAQGLLTRRTDLSLQCVSKLRTTNANDCLRTAMLGKKKIQVSCVKKNRTAKDLCRAF